MLMTYRILPSPLTVLTGTASSLSHRMARAFSLFASLLAALVVASSAAWAQSDTQKPVVVELFTSQGCSSCPPADKFLGDLAKRDDVIALAYHVDYWNRLGWVDPYSSEWATDLQSSYSRAHDRRNNYTPQMIVQGVADVIGSRRKAALAEIAAHQTKGFRRADVALSLTDDGQVSVSLGHLGRAVEADIVLLRYHRHKATQIGRGENGGRTLDYHNIVHERRVIGRWRGAAEAFTVPAAGLADDSGLVVMIQERNYGPIIGAGKLEP